MGVGLRSFLHISHAAERVFRDFFTPYMYEKPDGTYAGLQSKVPGWNS